MLLIEKLSNSKIRKSLLALAVSILAYTSSGLSKLEAAILNVPSQYSTIQFAINNADDGDEIVVNQGRYLENINFNGKNIILRSTNPQNQDIVKSTIIDGNQAGSVVTFAGSEGTSCTLEGFTITNGKHWTGGGIKGSATGASDTVGCKATIQNNYIRNNIAYGLWEWPPGSGKWNKMGFGGGIANCDGIIQNNIIANNYANGTGALIRCDGIIQNNTICNNNTDSGYGGLVMCRGIIYNCILWNNTSPQINDTPSSFSSSIPSYSNIQDGNTSGTGNISLDPQFVDPANGDFHLKPTSPCIDAGMRIVNLLFDIEGNARGVKGTTEQRGDGSNYDIGAYEYNPGKSAVNNRTWEMYE